MAQGYDLGNGAKGPVYQFTYILACPVGQALYMVTFKIQNLYYDFWGASFDKARVLQSPLDDDLEPLINASSLDDLTSNDIKHAWESSNVHGAIRNLAYDCPDGFSSDEPSTWTGDCAGQSLGMHNLEFKYCEV